mmetsp:Transcript_100668/g.300314  ORF Transcript_100668/g.300314 Transcript_100668/m.300314 type:complete len:223 (-) Transcript_100668:95-763(-)
MLREQVPEVLMAQVAAGLVEDPVNVHLLLPPVPQHRLECGPRVDLKRKGVRCPQLVVDPVETRPRARVADLLACCAERALAMILVERPENLHHSRLVSQSEMLHVERPRHVHAFGATVHCEERRGHVCLNDLLEDAGLRLTERPGSRVRVRWVEHGGRLPLLVPVAVQVDAIGVRSEAVAALLHLLAGSRVPVDHDLELAVPQDRRSLRRQASLAAEGLHQV